MRSLDRGMKRHYGRKKVFKIGFFQSILLLVISCLWSFLKHVRLMFLYLLHSNDNHENLAIVYPPLKVVHTSPHFIIDFDQNFPSKPCDDHSQVDEPHETKDDVSPLVLDPTPSKIQHRYQPLKLPHVLHNFPPKDYEYLHVFDGEPNAIIVEKHV